jgi:hypothetical protein
LTANPLELIGGITTTANVSKADIVAWGKARVPQVLANVTEIRNTVLAGQLAIFLKATGVLFFLDTFDTTTADDGVSCIISSDGFRFKPLSSLPTPTATGLGGVFSHVAVSHFYVTGINTDGSLATLQPSLADLTDSITGKSTDGTFASNSDTLIASQKATKTYVDTVAQGLDAKPSVLVATTANITLSGEQTIDGVLTSASRVLVKNQSTASQNGIYVSGSGAWTRAIDCSTWAELPGAFAFVEQGTTFGDCGFVCTVNAGGTLGTTAIAFVQFSGAGTYTNGTGLSLTGTTFSIDSTVATLTGAQALTNKTYNGNTWTAGTGVLTLAAGKTLTASNTVTFTATDGSSVALGTGGTVAYAANNLSVFAATTSAQLAGVLSDETGTGLAVFNNAPTLVAPVLGAATATTINKITITQPATGATLTIPDGVTLTGPAASGTAMTLGNVETVTGAKTFNDAKLILAGVTSGTTTLKSGAIAGSSVLTLPIATDTLVGKATTDTLTNKTFDTAGTGNSFSINGVAATANSGTGAVVRAAGAALTGLTGLAIRSTGAAFDMTFATAEVLTAGRTLSWVLGDAARTITLGGNPTINGGTHSGTNTGDQTITLTGDVTGSGTGSFAATVAANAITNAKMATMADGTIKSNISGGSAAPSDNTITAVLDKLGATQGQILYRNATTWVPLAPGSAGQFLTTQGAAANPNWSSGGAGTGTVTSVATAGLATGGPITASGTVTVTAVAKSDQTTGTSNALAVTPLHQQDHDSAAKAWVKFTGSSGAIAASYNVSSVTRSGTGTYIVNFTTAFATSDYVCSAASINNANNTFIEIDSAHVSASAMGLFAINSFAGAVVDPVSVMAVFYGRQ